MSFQDTQYHPEDAWRHCLHQHIHAETWLDNFPDPANPRTKFYFVCEICGMEGGDADNEVEALARFWEFTEEARNVKPAEMQGELF